MLENVFIIMPAYNAGGTIEKVFSRLAEVPIPTIYANEVSHLKPMQYGFDVLSVISDYKRGKYHRL